MLNQSDVSRLTLPRYVPFVIRGTVLAVWYDNVGSRYLVLCPKCHELIAYGSLSSLHQELVSSDGKCCQGCRARASFERNPGLIGLFLGFWHQTRNFPQSTTWLEAVPQPMLTLWAREIQSAFTSSPPQSAVRPGA